MRGGRRTNLALLALVVGSLGTGTAAYAVGTAPATTVVTTVHAAVGLALVLLVPWKATVVRAGLALPAHAGRGAGIALAVLLALSVVTGVLQEVVGFRPVLGLSPLQVHVATALVAGGLLAGHLVTHPQRLRRADLSRRSALRAGVLGLGALAAVALTRRVDPVAAAERSTGSSELGSGVPEQMPVTQWFTDGVPEPGDREVTLRVAGRAVLVEVVDEVDAVLDCTGGWYATQRWGGVRLDRLLGDLPDGTRSVEVVSVTGYRRRFPVEDLPHLLVATHAGGERLSAGHGGPRRLVAPGRRGFWWVKWVGAVEPSDAPAWWQPPFPLR